jgi:hypothetical protein
MQETANYLTPPIRMAKVELRPRKVTRKWRRLNFDGVF